MDAHNLPVHALYMVKKPVDPRHFLRAWRKHRDYTLEFAAEAVGITHATLSRIERGKVPYSQPLLEALAQLYRCEPADLIMRDPLSGGPWSIWDQIPPEQRSVLQNMMQGLVRGPEAPLALPAPARKTARR